MRRIDDNGIERLLAADRAPEPPADLAARIKAEIPDELHRAPGAGEAATPFRPHSGRRLLLAAAGVVIVAGSGLVAWRVLRPGLPGAVPEVASAPAARQVLPAPPPVAERSAKKGEQGDAVQAEARSTGERLSAAGGPPAEAPRRRAAPAGPPAARADAPAASGAGLTAQVRVEKHTLQVTVVDDSGARLPGATVGLVSSGGGTPAGRVASTDSRGVATFADVAPGRYTIFATLRGYAVARAQTVDVDERKPAFVALLMRKLPATETVASAGQSQALAPDASISGVPVGGRSSEATTRTDKRADGLLCLQNLVVQAGSSVPEGKKLRRAPRPLGAVPPSTGGTAEPNGRPYGDVFFEHSGVNPFIDTEDDALSTFGLDVDTASYTVARRYLDDGNLPDPASVRVEEFLNYFHYDDRPPRRGDFAITAEGAPTPFAKGDRYRILRFGIRAREIDTAHRKPAVLTFVVDVSGSMAREDRLGLVKRALYALLDQLRPDDEVALVVYGSRGQVLLEPTADREEVRAAIGRLAPGGSTNAEEGLVLGYDVASRAFRRGAVNRVVLCSDGVANVGRTGPESIIARIGSEAKRGIELTTVGFGMGNYNDVLLEQLADKGNGRYAYVDNFKEARRIFVEDLTGTLQTVAADAKVQVEFNPKVVARYRLLGYENRDIADERFRDDTVDAGEIGAGHAVTALYEVKLREHPEQGEPAATLRLRYRPADGKAFVETSHEVRLRDFAPSWDAASPSLRLASLVAELAEILKGSYWAKDGSLDDVFRRAQRLSPEFPGDADVAEFVALAGAAARLKAPVPATPVADGDGSPQRR